MLEEKKKPKESWEDFEQRTWQDKAHYDESGHVFIPAFAFKQAIDSAAKYLGKIPGKGASTWSKHFTGGVVISEGVVLNLKRDDLKPVWINANANGKRGSGTRVRRCFPVVPKWTGSITCLVPAEEITEAIFAKAMELSGMMVGIGRFRPENGGINGRFTVKSIKWTE
jgi:hypothetical protein